MLNSLIFKIKADVDIDKYRLLELFFRDWVDNTCNREVQYKIEDRGIQKTSYTPSNILHTQIFEVEFENQEDALALKLRGVPDEFRGYLEIIS